MTSLFNYDKIRRLIYTEKSNRQLSDGKYHFHVEKSCDKNEIASIIKKAFKVRIKKINVINTKPKIKIFRGIKGNKSSYKKVIVTLDEGNSINFGS